MDWKRKGLEMELYEVEEKGEEREVRILYDDKRVFCAPETFKWCRKSPHFPGHLWDFFLFLLFSTLDTDFKLIYHSTVRRSFFGCIPFGLVKKIDLFQDGLSVCERHVFIAWYRGIQKAFIEMLYNLLRGTRFNDLF